MSHDACKFEIETIYNVNPTMFEDYLNEKKAAYK